MMPAREDISDLRAGVRFWLFLNGVDTWFEKCTARDDEILFAR